MKNFLFILFITIPGIIAAQEHAYVNTNNLILRDRPEKIYRVFAILHAPCEVSVLPYDNAYNNNRSIKARFYRVSYIKRNEQQKTSEVFNGWVEKKFTVVSRAHVTVPFADTVSVLVTVIPSIPYIGSDEHSPNPFNCNMFRYPKYKGGEKYFNMPVAFKRVYHPGPRGGCYYLDPKGKKRYVDPKYCK